MKKIYLVIPLLILGCSDTNFSYPASEKKPLSYDAHGETINDPYLYMEDCQNLEVIEWSDKQNAFTNNYLDGPEYDELYQQISEAYSSEYYSMSYFDEESDYYYYNSCLLYTSDAADE